MKTRVLTSIAVVAVILLPVLSGGWLLFALGVLVIFFGAYEWMHCLPGFKTWGYPLMILSALWVIGFPYALAWLGSKFMFLYLVPAVTAIWALPVFIPSFDEQDSFAVISFLVVFAAAFSVFPIFVEGQVQYLWTLILATYGSDTGAYFAGRFLGKHKMIERISPKKTWEGFFGGWAAGFLLSWLVSLLYAGSVNFMLNLLICILAPVFAELGDLCFSAFKRHFQKKDFSSLLPGHGGVLDRVDSLLMNLIIFGILYTILL